MTAFPICFSVFTNLILFIESAQSKTKYNVEKVPVEQIFVFQFHVVKKWSKVPKSLLMVHYMRDYQIFSVATTPILLN